MIRRLPRLDDAARAGLRDALDGYEAEFARQIEAGIAQLWQVDDGFLIVRIEHAADHAPELVICALQGVAIDRVGPLLIEAGKRAGCGSIRMHTRRRGLGRMVRKFGMVLDEWVYSLRLCHG
ncbi:MAG TPA: hypothetical protein ENJ79_07830 [Gammaproteobacteria bacterium]|nr:hypothetical protein [Gammaproteobacteria bacterium]